VTATTSSNSPKFRLYALSAVLCLWLLTICLRLVYLQIFCYGDFERRAQHQQQRSFDLSAKRDVDSGGFSIRGAVGGSRSSEYDQPDHTHY